MGIKKRVKLKKKKKISPFFQPYQPPYLSDGKKGSNSTIGNRSGGALAIGKPDIK